MQPVSIVASLRDAEARRRQEAVAAMKPELRRYARAHGGRFILFGSAARGEMRFHSDVDLLVDFPEEGEAWDFAEALCARFGLEADVTRLSWCKDAFVAHITRDAEVIA